MKQVYMDCIGLSENDEKVYLDLFFNEIPTDHIEELKGFLRYQHIDVDDFNESNKKKLEFVYFSNGFKVSYNKNRWSFFQMRDYVYGFLSTLDPELVKCNNYLKKFEISGKTPTFDDHFYLEISRMLDAAEDRYYIGNRSISLFITSILRILQSSLNLYWAQASVKSIQNDREFYENVYPTTINKEALSHPKSKIINYPVIFNDEGIARFDLCMGPFTPKKEIVDFFTEFVLMQIDDFIYGDLLFRQETATLKQRIVDLEQQILKQNAQEFLPKEKEEICNLKHTHILFIGDSPVSVKFIMNELGSAGFNKKNVTLITDYKRMTHFDKNNVLKCRGKFDGVILGPMPHSIKGATKDGSSLIAQMENFPTKYPPFVVLRDGQGALHISKTNLKLGLKTLAQKIRQVDRYEIK